MPFLYIKAMPTYEYECKSCNHSFEAFQSMSDAPLSECPLCKKELRRLINGGSGIIFKGSGFYVTDKNKDSGKQSSFKTSKTKSEGKIEGKNEGKGAEAADVKSPCSACPASGKSGEGACPAAEKAAG